MIETARGHSVLDEICAVHGLSGVYVGPADLAISLGYGPADAWTEPTVRDAMARIQAAVSAAGLVAGIHAVRVGTERRWPSWAFARTLWLRKPRGCGAAQQNT